MTDTEATPEVVGDLYIEPTYGTRSWEITDDGMLRGIYYKQIWQPGVNTAECRKGEVIYPIYGGYGLTVRGKQLELFEPSGWAPKSIRREGHRMLDCTCGFHMYREGSRDYGQPHYRSPRRVTGVVKGHGIWVAGSVGDRVEKVEILALVLPVPPRAKSPWHRFRHWSDDHAWKLMFGAVCTYVAAAVVAAATGDGLPWWVWVVWSAAMLATGVHTVGVTLPYRCCRDIDRPAHISPQQVAMIRANYPDVHVFPTFEDMVAAYPNVTKEGQS